ncbi:MAG: adenosine deaminase [Spirochaetes bacterium]|nr:adenosine deaminase [Spirochaetota bacterium]
MKCFESKYNDIYKTELHCHLEGAIRTATIIDVAKQYKINLPSYEEAILNQSVKVYDQLKDLQSVLNAFGIAQNTFVSEKVAGRIAYEVFEDAGKQNIKLFEVRFSPDWAFCKHQLDWDKAFESILMAKSKAEQDFDMAIGIIVIASRGMGLPSCEKTFNWAKNWKKNILAIDLADSEAQFPIHHFKNQVMKAKEAGFKVTIHSGEDTPAQAVIDTVNEVCPDRIGHGIHIIEDIKAVQLIKEKEIPLEINPWSNYLTNSVKTIEEHPLKKLFDLGIKTTISSDDPEILETNLNNEYKIAHEILGMSFDDIQKCNLYAIEASFISEDTKKHIKNKYFC